MSIFRADLLAGRRAFVTGGGSGICQGIARELAAHGAHVAVTGRRAEALDETVKSIEAAGGRAVSVTSDVREPARIRDAVSKAVETLGGLDIVINGAAGNFLAPAAQLSENGFRTVIDIDLNGTFNTTKACFESLLESEHAAVINISATLHHGGTPLQVHAASAKAGVDAMTKTLAVEWGPMGIRVNAIAPGPIDGTAGMAKLAPGDIRKRVIDRIPLKRFGQIDEIAQAAVYLASDAAAYVNGAILVVDGGESLAGMSLAEMM